MIDMIERLSKSGAIAIYMNMRCGNEKNIYSTFFNNLEAAISNVYVEMKRCTKQGVSIRRGMQGGIGGNHGICPCNIFNNDWLP